MIMNAVVAFALGLTPAHPGHAVQTFNYRERDYAGLVGPYRQEIDRHGTTHLRGLDRNTGEPFELAVRDNGHVEGTVGDTYMVFWIHQAA